ncbi:0b6a04c2-53f9-4e69-987d-e2876cf9a18b [Thermothielavioides terrestris]|uniref:0b6a04c2-53f9-4e69-987d-e2876cf9a18b n=1 Tax=Thermothielavioides terrestris TaxID=2587410 RepID=A0A3S4AMQ2_9PEZI|nr:0b6a04c2-53f9-4e69-987d-e2876cf9a18b [Thermothielavioides terrestris]
MPSETLYAMPRTLCHSLEAFAGHVDINRIRPWGQADESVLEPPA